MSHQSLSMIVAAADRDAANQWMETIGRGPSTFAIPLSPTGVEPATHFGAHTFDDELAEMLAAGMCPAVFYRVASGVDSINNFNAFMTEHGVEQIGGADDV